MRMYLKLDKAGVSLIAVLLFMLIATIAATATWKWITSEGKSSASRMLQREAYQSAQAGIDNARAWMAFHANDVGALIKQYVEDPAHQPINIDNQLRGLQRAGQNYHVWLTGVNTENTTFKLKILSSGESRNNTRHNESAIFNVDGLYQVAVPYKKTKKNVNFKFNYFGGSTQAQGHTHSYSVLINGNYNSSNPLYTEEDLIVTGNVNMSGTGVGADGTACIGGNLDGNNGVFGNNFYVGGDASNFAFPTESEAKGVKAGNNGPFDLVGDVYIEGNLNKITTGGGQHFRGSLSLGGVWTTNFQASKEASVDGSLCMGTNGQVYFPTLPSSAANRFVVGGHFYAKNSRAINVPISEFKSLAQTGNTATNYDYIHLGTTSDSKVYLTGAKGQMAYRDDYRNKTDNFGRIKPYDPNKTNNYQSYQSAKAKLPGLMLNTFYYDYASTQYFVDLNPPTVLFTNDPDDNNKTKFFINGSLATEYFTDNSTHGCVVEDGSTDGDGTEEEHTAKFPKCHVYPWFKSDAANGNVYGSVPSAKPADIPCADATKAYCMEKLGTKVANSGCDGADYKVDDLLVTAYSKFIEKANLGCNVTKWGKGKDSDNNEIGISQILNDCYENNKSHKSNLYNGYQVVKISNVETADATTPLEGKFIIVVENQVTQQMKLPPTNDGSYVFLYLEKGTGQDVSITNTGSGTYNYFIYTKGNMGSFIFNDEVLSGSIYAEAASCAKAADFKARRLDFNENLMSDLVTEGIICDASVGAASCGNSNAVASSSSGGGSSSAVVTDVDIVNTNMDRFFISMAPQLGVTLESQSKSNETLPPVKRDGENNDLQPSYIILPRVLSLPDDPYGSFEDYINVVPLNGSQLTKQDISLYSCTPITAGAANNLPTTLNGKLYSPSGAKLHHGDYKCLVQAAGTAYPQKVPFWVVVGASHRSVPKVSFKDPYQTIASTNAMGLPVQVLVTAHDLDIELNVRCPDAPTGWAYVHTPEAGGTTCKITIPAEPSKDEVITLFEVTTSGASTGSLQFQLLSGEGYNLETPTNSLILLASTVNLTRENVARADIETYCESNSDCPADIDNWPNCDIEEKWVEPGGTGFSAIENYRNDNWTVFINGSGSLQLTPKSDKCVVIIPSASLDVAALTAGNTYTLKASAKAKANKLKIVYKGVESGVSPIVNVKAGTRATKYCQYNPDEEIDCQEDVFSNELISLSINKDLSANEGFSYWKCSGPSCPSEYAVSSANYDSFKLSDNTTTIEVHFGENDKHCFFDEFKYGAVQCGATGSHAQYCIKNCEPSNCESAQPTNASDISKWHLISGNAENLNFDARNGMLSVSNGGDVTVLSTVTAGRLGTLKALVQIPRVASGVDYTSASVRNTGFLLRSNDDASSYLMLNIFADNSGRVVAQVCTEDGSHCRSGILTRYSSPLYTNDGNMMMISATLYRSDELMVSAFKGNYYGVPNVYTKTFDLAEIDRKNSIENLYVGYRLANKNFKLYGVGWISEEFASECYDTPPTVKCSFAAKADETGVIPTGVKIEPWVGHSGWYDSREDQCEKRFYYYNGADACGGTTTVTDCSDGYTFDITGAGLHGFDNNGSPTKTAKAGIQCNLSGTDNMWATPDDETSGELSRAHCGTFWTGRLTNCTQHINLMSSEITLNTSGAEQTVSFDNPINLRAARILVDADNVDGSEIRITLYSESGEGTSAVLHASRTISMTNSHGDFDVLKDFAIESGNVTPENVFDPENVKQILFLNQGTGHVVIKSAYSSCSAIAGVSECRARVVEDKWVIDATITNIDNVTNYQVTGYLDDKGPGNDDQTLNVTGGWIVESSVHKNGNKIEFDPYTFKTDGKPMPMGDKHDYSFTVYVKSSGGAEHSRQCSVTKSKPGDISCSATLIGADGGAPQVKFVLSHCPPHGCGGYVVKLDGQNINDGTGSCPGVGIGHETCTVQKTVLTGSHTVTLTSTSTPNATFECDPFQYGSQSQSSVSITGCSDITGQDPSGAVEINPTITGCGNGCTYSVSPHTTDVAEGTSGLYFYNVSGSGPVSHTLTATSNDGTYATCSFNVTYTAQTSSSTVTTSTSVETSTSTATTSTSVETSTSTATTSTSVETSTSVMTSSSAAGVQTIVGNQFPQQIDIPSGTCMSLKGTWTAEHQAPIVLRCNAGGSITATYGESSATDNYYVMLDLGTKTSYSATEVTFVSNVCITSNASDLKCGFGTK